MPINGAERRRLAMAVVRLRHRKNLSWVDIGRRIGHSASLCRTLYDEVRGPGAHVGRLPGKGGRLPANRQRRATDKVRHRQAA